MKLVPCFIPLIQYPVGISVNANKICWYSVTHMISLNFGPIKKRLALDKSKLKERLLH